MWLCSKRSSFFPFMHCPLVANRKTQWSIHSMLFEFLFYNSSQNEKSYHKTKRVRSCSLIGLSSSNGRTHKVDIEITKQSRGTKTPYLSHNSILKLQLLLTKVWKIEPDVDIRLKTQLFCDQKCWCCEKVGQRRQGPREQQQCRRVRHR